MIGKLNDNTFSQSANGELNGKKYNFKTTGFMKQTTQIRDALNNMVVGEITFDNWMTKADITVLNKKAKWKYDNLWNSKWRISSLDGIEIKYAGSPAMGKIDSNTDDPILLLSGLFVTNYYLQMTIVLLVAVFLPIFITFII